MTDTWDEAAWGRLRDELDAWVAARRRATLWWRDDDAGPDRPALARLLALAAGAGVPLGLAVVPAWLEPAAGARIAGAPAAVRVLQHGSAHVDHEPPAGAGASRHRAAELGGARPVEVVETELRDGWMRLTGALGPRCLPVLVPPWNRIGPAVIAALPRMGYRGLSTFGPRPRPEAVPGLRWLNCHVDPVRWREDRRFAGATGTLDALRAHLARRRHGTVDPAEPTGLLTHHRDLAPAAWRCLEALLPRLRAHPAADWPPIDALAAPAA
jgi:hypothetical protein